MSPVASNPATGRRLLRETRIRLIAARLCSTKASRDRLVELLETERVATLGDPEPIALSALGGEAVHIRAGASDADVLLGAFHGRYHLPQTKLSNPRLIWDLGANVGLTMRQMAAAFPAARIVGVELDPANAELARRNLAPIADRSELVEGAVWTEPGTLTYGIPETQVDGEDGFRVDESGAGSAQAVPLDDLLARFGTPDYVKMDIEGAEREVLRRNTDWASPVDRIGVEYHRPYSPEDCEADLRSLGFANFEAHRRGLLHRGSDSLYAARVSSASSS